MTIRSRKLLGTLLLVLFIVIYALLAMEVGAARFAEASAISQVLYFLIAGTAWVVPAGFLIRWMQRPDTTPE